MSKKSASAPICPIDFALRRIRGKHRGRILWYLSNYEILRFGELRKYTRDITTKMLTQTLRELESDGLVNRKAYHEIPPKVEYSLTESSKELILFIKNLRAWGESEMEKEKIPNMKHYNAC